MTVRNAQELITVASFREVEGHRTLSSRLALVEVESPRVGVRGPTTSTSGSKSLTGSKSSGPTSRMQLDSRKSKSKSVRSKSLRTARRS
jgi:hypothetical protein